MDWNSVNGAGSLRSGVGVVCLAVAVVRFKTGDLYGSSALVVFAVALLSSWTPLALISEPLLSVARWWREWYKHGRGSHAKSDCQGLELQATGNTVRFVRGPIDKEGSSSLKLKNTSDDYYAYRIRSTHPDVYYASPPSGVVGPKSEVVVTTIMLVPEKASNEKVVQASSESSLIDRVLMNSAPAATSFEGRFQILGALAKGPEGLSAEEWTAYPKENMWKRQLQISLEDKKGIKKSNHKAALYLEPDPTISFGQVEKFVDLAILRVYNTSSSPMAFRIRTKIPDMFLVTPARGVVEPNTLQEVCIRPIVFHSHEMTTTDFLFQSAIVASAESFQFDQWSKFTKEDVWEKKLLVGFHDRTCENPIRVHLRVLEFLHEKWLNGRVVRVVLDLGDPLQLPKVILAAELGVPVADVRFAIEGKEQSDDTASLRELCKIGNDLELNMVHKAFVELHPLNEIKVVKNSETQAKGTLTLTNKSSNRIAFRIMCTSPSSYSVSPSVGSLEPNSVGQVQITLKDLSCTDLGQHRFSIRTVVQKSEELPTVETWKSFAVQQTWEQQITGVSL